MIRENMTPEEAALLTAMDEAKAGRGPEVIEATGGAPAEVVKARDTFLREQGVPPMPDAWMPPVVSSRPSEELFCPATLRMERAVAWTLLWRHLRRPKTAFYYLRRVVSLTWRLWCRAPGFTWPQTPEWTTPNSGGTHGVYDERTCAFPHGKPMSRLNNEGAMSLPFGTQPPKAAAG